MLEYERNCYLCPLVEVEIKRKDLERIQSDYFKLERENKDLKILLGEKIVKEYQERTKPKKEVVIESNIKCAECKYYRDRQGFRPSFCTHRKNFDKEMPLDGSCRYGERKDNDNG